MLSRSRWRAQVRRYQTPGDITEDIRRLIAESRAVIADLSGTNSNVMWELGFATPDLQVEVPNPFSGGGVYRVDFRWLLPDGTEIWKSKMIARGNETILVSSDPLKDLPFDIRSQRVLRYQRSGLGLDDLKGKIAEALMSIA